MDIRQLRYCAAVAYYQNYTKAAENLFISRQALSKSIKQLEKELGNDIFILEGNNLVWPILVRPSCKIATLSLQNSMSCNKNTSGTCMA